MWVKKNTEQNPSRFKRQPSIHSKQHSWQSLSLLGRTGKISLLPHQSVCLRFEADGQSLLSKQEKAVCLNIYQYH